MGTRVSRVEFGEPRDDLLIGRHIDQPQPGAEGDDAGVEVIGWVAGIADNVVEVVISCNGRFWRTVPLGGERPDLRAAFPLSPHAACAGFRTKVGLRGMTRGDIEISAKLDDGAYVHLATVGLERVPDAGPAGPLGAVGTIDLGDLRRLEPVSEEWGYERGHPIDRYYIEAFLERYAGEIVGRTLEILDDTYTRRFGGDRVTEAHVLDIDPANAEATIVADLTDAADVPSDHFDAIIVTQTLHLIHDIRSAVRTLHRILAPGGTLLVTSPGISPIGHQDVQNAWSWGLTANSASELFGEFFGPEEIQVESFGNVLSASAFVYGLAQEDVLPAEMDVHDPYYPVTIAVRAQKANGSRGPGHERGRGLG